MRPGNIQPCRTLGAKQRNNTGFAWIIYFGFHDPMLLHNGQGGTKKLR
jgi:hypothetical protein